MLKRKIYDRLLEWKRKSNGKSAILVDGARRVGKSFIVEAFAKAEYKSHVLINFSKGENQVKALFGDYLDDLDTFFSYLEAIKHVKLHRRESLVIFDEVQSFPKAREAIKHLVADGRFDYIETGSLVSINENVEDILIPSEEEDVEMYPLDFEEFLWAKGDFVTMDFVRKCFTERRPLGLMHKQIMDAFREYMIVGGMPQVVNAYVQTRDFMEVDAEKRRMLKLYRKGIQKHARRYALRVERIYDELPGQLGKHEKKFSFSSLGRNARLREYEDAVFWLKDAMVVNVAYAATEPNMGLALNRNMSAMKCYFFDTGLFVSHAFDARRLNAEDVHKRLLFDDLSVNEGMLAENVVAQMLTAAGHPLYFYSRYDEKKDNRMEIDFLIAKSKLTKKNNIHPIEVKSGKRIMHVSLDKFRTKYADWLDEPYLLWDRDLKVEDGIAFLPLYMTPLL